MKKFIFAMGVIAMSLTTMACNSQNSKMQEVQDEIAHIERIAKDMDLEELRAEADRRSYTLGAQMGIAANFQFADFDLNIKQLKNAIVDFYVNGDAESEGFAQNNTKFQMFIYTKFMPYMQAKRTYDAMVAGDMTEGLPEIPELYDEEYTKEFITETLGAQMAATLMNLDGINMGWVFKGFNDGMNIKEQTPEAIEEALIFTMDEIQEEFMAIQKEMMAKAQAEAAKRAEEARIKAEEAKVASAEWLAEIEKMEGVVKTESGLLYRIDREGTGAFATADNDTVEVNYEGKTRDGKIFDSSYERGESISFALNRVIRGWTEGMKYVAEGGQITLWIPSELAYGERGAGENIGGNEALEFKVELIKVTPAM